VVKKLLALLIVGGVLGLTTGCPPDTQTRDKTRTKGGKEGTPTDKKTPIRTKTLDAGDKEKKDRDEK